MLAWHRRLVAQQYDSTLLDGSLREYISNQADLLGAIRPPVDAFKKNTNTEVATDIVMLHKWLPFAASGWMV